MAKYNDGFGVCFNDNDGGAGWFTTPCGMDEYKRHVELMGRWRAKLFFMRKLWISLRNTEQVSIKGDEPRWKNLKGWKP